MGVIRECTLLLMAVSRGSEKSHYRQGRLLTVGAVYLSIFLFSSKFSRNSNQDRESEVLTALLVRADEVIE